MVRIRHLGYGSFHDPGQAFFGASRKVRRVFFRPDAPVFATLPAQARRIQRRVRARKRRSAKKGAGHEPN